MVTHKTVPGRSRNSMIPRAIVEKDEDMYLRHLKNGAADMIRRMGPETEQVDVLIADPITQAGIGRDLQAANFTLDMVLVGVKSESVKVEPQKDGTFRITRQKKTPPALPIVPPARGFAPPPSAKKR